MAPPPRSANVRISPGFTWTAKVEEKKRGSPMRPCSICLITSRFAGSKCSGYAVVSFTPASRLASIIRRHSSSELPSGASQRRWTPARAQRTARSACRAVRWAR